jgi:hypothetical protein
VKVKTPLGEYPFEFRGIERRDRSLVISGNVAGLQSSAVLGREDLLAAAKALGPSLALTALAAIALRCWARRRRRRRAAPP